MDENLGVVSVIDSIDAPEIPIVASGGRATAVVSPRTGASHRTMNLVRLDRGGSTIELTHGQDAVYYVAAGSGHVLGGTPGETHDVAEGAMVHVDAGDAYRFSAEGTDGMTIIGGPCPADAALYADAEA